MKYRKSISGEKAPNSKQHQRSVLRNWRFTIIIGIISASCVFLINLTLLIWAKINLSPATDAPGSSTSVEETLVAYSGSCAEARNVSTVAHLAVNILSTALLAASNSCMQCLVAPTRDEIDLAHDQGKTLEIGVQSLKNLRDARRFKRVLWGLLVISSLPLHLLYNSVLVDTGTANTFAAAFVTPQFLHGDAWDSLSLYCSRFSGGNVTTTAHYLQDAGKSFKLLSSAECIAAYNTQFVSGWGNVVVVGLETGEALLNIFNGGGTSDATDWMCGTDAQQCDLSSIRTNPQQWSLPRINSSTCVPGGTNPSWPVSHCLAQPTPEKYTLRLSPTILIVVLVSNVIKLICFGMTLYIIKDPLITIGDAIASFLKEPEPLMSGWSTMNANQAGKWIRDPNFRAKGPRPWFSQRHLWVHAASRARWLHCMTFFLALWICAIVLLIHSGQVVRDVASTGGPSNILQTGVGKINSEFTMSFTQGSYIGQALLSNIVQLVLSFFYFYYNDLLTRMLLVREWMAFANTRKTPRVSSQPQGQQRSTRFLQVPFKFAIPLLILFTSLHWLVSQSIYVVFVEGWDYSQGPRAINMGFQISGTEFSPLALLLAFLLGTIMIAGLCGTAALGRYDRDVPIVGSSTAAIAAAYQSGSEGESIVYEEVMSGNVREESHYFQRDIGMDEDNEVEGNVGHATFTSGRASRLVEGRWYD